MQLTTFISSHMDSILVEWDIFARSLFPATATPPQHVLRDHAREILQEIVQDMLQDQTQEQQVEKSKGEADQTEVHKSAASMHGTLRQASGFTLIQLTAEYRALRATVFRLWRACMAPFTEQTANEITRFNEAMDQALAESVVTYSDNADRTRDTFLAILGHDLRSPLSTLTMAGSYLTMASVGTESTRQMGARVRRSSATMHAMVNDLLVYARTQLGGGIPLSIRQEDLHHACEAAVDDAQAGHPDCPFELKTFGNLVGAFDAARLQQLFSNLLNNAAQYRSAAHPVTLTARGEPDAVVVEVCNFGPVIPAAAFQAIFDPLVQLAAKEGSSKAAASSSMGLGLFIAREITEAHGGALKVASNAQTGTVFTATLPRTAPTLATQ